MRFWMLVIGGAVLLGLAAAVVATVVLLRSMASDSDTAWAAIVAIEVHAGTYFAAAVLAVLGLVAFGLAGGRV